ncbi:TolC family protein [Sulfurihydrogenibium sp.]|uniref:TolC family protein n=1 Tax=Sulfurihydrogenibium sp. TaxID=2053621 RepID=UPI002635D97A|nr:TolC family protein [Sulfurihydrogenibium sp.]
MVRILIFTLLALKFSFGESLDELIDLALKHNPQLKKIEKELPVLKEKSEVAKKLPNPSFSLSYNSGINLSMRQYVPWYEKLELSKEIEKQNYRAYFYIYQIEKNKLIRQIKENAYQIKVYRDKINLIEKYQNDINNLLKFKTNQYEINKLKILNTDLEVEKLDYQNQVEKLISKIKELVNYDIKDVEVDEINIEENLILEKVLREAEESSPLVKNLEENLKKDRLSYKLAKEIYYPDVSLGITYKSKERFQDAFSAGINLNLNFPFWRTLGQEQVVLERKLFLVSQQEQKLQLLNNLKSTIVSLYVDYQYKLKKLKVFIETKQVYEDDFKNSYKKFSLSEVNFQDFLTSFSEKKKSDYSLLDLKLNTAISILKIKELINLEN